jgi:predicted DsbA family dithiol-disulfide isomerase
MATPVRIDVVSDVICPWCFIGKRRLEKALGQLNGEIDTRITWLPFQLNPEMPIEGIARAQYREQKFGSLERSRALNARLRGIHHQPEIRSLRRPAAGGDRSGDQASRNGVVRHARRTTG